LAVASVAVSVPRQVVQARHVGTAGEDIVPLSRLMRAVSGTYNPAQLREDYDLNPVYAAGIKGQGVRIGIVDVYGSPTIRADLATFDHHYGIPAPPSFTIVRPAGKVPAFNAFNSEMLGWAGETTLDVEWAHAMAPEAAIVLAVTGVDEVEGTSGMAAIMTAERYLIQHEGVAVISQSFAATEETFPSKASLMSFRGTYRLAESRHVTILGATGDTGAASQTLTNDVYYDHRVVNWPASDPLVTAVGGTQVLLNSAGKQVSPTRVWNDDGTSFAVPSAGGGGVSADFGRPVWQSGVAGVVGAHRGLPDISMDASCDPGVFIFSSFFGSGYEATCGTSLASPLFAGVVALADQLAGHHLGLLNPTLYRLGAAHAAGLVDVTLGNNSVSVPVKNGTAIVKGYDAVKGYDLASGWGTVKAADLVAELAGKKLP
jgi:subtilase family serine protease